MLFKALKKLYFFNIFLLLTTSILYDLFLFLDNILINPLLYICIVFLYLTGWSIALRSGRFITSFFLIFNFLFFCLFKEYYKFYVLPLDVFLFKDSFSEGVDAGIKNIRMLFDFPFFLFLTILIFQLWITFKNSFYNFKKLIKYISFVSCIGILYFGYMILVVHANRFSDTLFWYQNQQNMLYKFDWTTKLLFSKENKLDVNAFILDSKKNYQEMISDDIYITIPNHVFVIQAESLTTKALSSMPFLSNLSIQKNAKMYEDKFHTICLGSANTDFMMLTGLVLDCSSLKCIVYDKLSFEVYKELKTMPQVLKEKGYKTAFLHSYEKYFYNRNLHMPYMGFDTVVFEEDFETKIPRYEWGVDDFELFKKATQLIDENQKTFQFIITNGMHTPFTSMPPSFSGLNLKSDEDRYLKTAEFLDKAFEWFYKKAPKDSLFIIYGDHAVSAVNGFDTPTILIYKGDNDFKMPIDKKEGFKKTIYYINSMFL